MGREFSRDEIFRGDSTLEDFARILIRNYFYVPCFLFVDSILRVEMLRVSVLCKFSPGLNCPEDISAEGWIFVELDFQELSIKRSDIKVKKKTSFIN